MNQNQKDVVVEEILQPPNQRIFQRRDGFATNRDLEVMKQGANSDTNDVYIVNEAIGAGKEYVAYDAETRDELISKILGIGKTMLRRDEFNEAMNLNFEGQDKLIEMFDTMLQEMKARNLSIF